jgi:hypothetical protein
VSSAGRALAEQRLMWMLAGRARKEVRRALRPAGDRQSAHIE